jgi:hypothetical protein
MTRSGLAHDWSDNNEEAMASRKLTAINCSGWVLLGSSLLAFALSYYRVGPDWMPLIAVTLLVIGIIWWLKAVPAFRRQFRLDEAARQHEATFTGDYHATGDEGILRATSLRLEPQSNRSVWLSDDNKVVGSVVGTHEMGRIWVTAIDSDERVLLQLRCANPGAWYHYGYKRKVRWLVAESNYERTVGVIELRPTFLGRFKWPITTEMDPKFGQVKAGVEWSRMMVGPAGALVAAVIPNLEHHATVFMRSRPVCAISWSGRSAVLTFVHGEWEISERQLAIGAAVLVACCPNYYRHA